MKKHNFKIYDEVGIFPKNFADIVKEPYGVTIHSNIRGKNWFYRLWTRLKERAVYEENNL